MPYMINLSALAWTTIKAVANFNKDSNNSGQFSIGHNYTLNVASGVSVSATTAFNVWGSNSFLNIAEGAKVSANGGICLAGL